MSVLISLVVFIIVVGVILYLLNLIPMDATIKRIGTVIFIAIAAIYALLTFVVPLLHNVPHLR